MAHGFLRSTHTWRVPPNWSPRDWCEELKAEASAATWEAERDFDPARRPPGSVRPATSLGSIPEALSAGMDLCPALRDDSAPS